MANPQVLDFSAEAEDAITITFPGGKHSCELPTMEELTMEAFQFVASNGEEWYELFNKKGLTETDRKRFDHLNRHLAYALCEGVPQRVVDTLKPKQRARVIMDFMTGSPLPELIQQAASQLTAPVKKPPAKRRKTSR